jgi:hypothetical protein
MSQSPTLTHIYMMNIISTSIGQKTLTHWHEHRPIEHVHPHVPDMHHVHRH